MSNIVYFEPKRKKSPVNRIEALVKGELEVYVCDTCGEEFEVAFGNKPEVCPHCNRLICWENEE